MSATTTGFRRAKCTLIAIGLIAIAAQGAAPSPPAPVETATPKLLVTSAPGDSMRSVLAGVYTAAQAEEGAAVFRSSCGKCHETTRFTGPSFQKTWAGGTLFTLFDRMRAAMPMDNPGGLSRAEYVAVIAYILDLNDYPSASEALPVEGAELRRIRFEMMPSLQH